VENLLFVLKPTEQNSSGAGWRASLPRSHCGYWRAGWAASGGRGGGAHSWEYREVGSFLEFYNSNNNSLFAFPITNAIALRKVQK